MPFPENSPTPDDVPSLSAAERAAVAGQLFGEEGSIAMSRIDSATLRQATEDVLAFGVVVSEQDADQIERTNNAISRLGLIWRGLSNQLAVTAAPRWKRSPTPWLRSPAAPGRWASRSVVSSTTSVA